MSDKPDDLLQRYADAVAQDERRPSDRVRDAVRAHAQMQLTQTANPTVVKPQQHAANQNKWTLSLVASIAMVALTGLLVIQIQHGSPDDREVAFGGPSPNKPLPAAAPDASRAPAVASVAVPPQKTAEATPPLPMPAMAAKPAPVAAERRVADAQATRAATEPAQPAKRLAAPVVATREAGPEAAPAKLQMDAAQSVAKSAYTSADTLSNSPAPRDAKALAHAETTPGANGVMGAAGASARPMPAAPAPASVMAAAAPPPPVLVAPSPQIATAAAPGTLRHRADIETSAPLTVRFLAAVRNGRLDDMDALLAQGASLNARDESGNTALMIALGERQVATARKLLERGADANLVNREGVNALQIAVRMDLPEMVKLLQLPTR